jgi:hypothetical protein
MFWPGDQGLKEGQSMELTAVQDTKLDSDVVTERRRDINTPMLSRARRYFVYFVERRLTDGSTIPIRSPFAKAHRIACELVAADTKLIPIYIHRMLPSEPHLAGNPVFSVYKTDVIYYEAGLRDYLIYEFLAWEDAGIWPLSRPSGASRV